MKLKFIADVHISPLTVKELQKAGYTITRVTDNVPSTASDTEIIQLANKEQKGHIVWRLCLGTASFV